MLQFLNELKTDDSSRLRCPACHRADVRPSWPVPWKDTIPGIFSYRPYRCRACSNRFYSRTPRALEPDPVDDSSRNS